MKISRIIVALVVLSALLSLTSSETVIAKNESGKCRVFSFDEAYSASEAVFVGKVSSVEKNGDVKTFVFEVEKYWKGTNQKEIKIYVYETMRYQAYLQTGERYLIYANPNNEGKLSVGRCSRSREAEDAKEDLKKLGAGKKPV